MSNFDALRSLRADGETMDKEVGNSPKFRDWLIGGSGFVGILTVSTWMGIAQAMSLFLIVGVPLGAGAALIGKGYLLIGIPLFIFGPVLMLALCGSLVQMCVFPLLGLITLWLILSIFGIHGDIQGYIGSAPFLVGIIWLIGVAIGALNWVKNKMVSMS